MTSVLKRRKRMFGSNPEQKMLLVFLTLFQAILSVLFTFESVVVKKYQTRN